MKSSTLSSILLASGVAAYPGMMVNNLARDASPETLQVLENLKRQVAPPQGAGALPLVPPPFDAASQHVSTTGAHAYVAPGPGDARGPCPGLNAMANHNYIPHNGVATITEFVAGTEAVFGMSPELGLILAVLGAVNDGDGTSWSIDGDVKTGIGGSHGNYEGDSSPTRADLFQYGYNDKLVMSQFKALYNMQPNAKTANYNLEVMRDFRAHRLQESKDKNPEFVYGPITGILVSQAAYTFIYRFMSNKTAEAPEGILNKAVLKSFMSITGPENNLKYTPGHERIPDNWYKRNDLDQYSLVSLNEDILYFAETVPEILDIGCNKGAVDTFSAIDPSTLSNGAYTAAQVAANPVCFATQFLNAELPALEGIAALSPLLTKIGTVLNCPIIKNANRNALAACPGFTFYGGPTAPVAPGAIQN